MGHAATMRRVYDTLNSRDIDGFADLMADDAIEHEELPGFEPTKAGIIEFFRAYLAAFPDLRMDAQDVSVSGDEVVARVRATGTNEGDFMGMQATGKRMDVQLIDIMRFGLSTGAGWIRSGAMMQQLGIVPDGSPS